MAGSDLPHILLVGGDGGYSGVPAHLRQLVRALEGRARITIVADRNQGGYDFVAASHASLVQIEGLRSSLNPLRAWRAVRALKRLMTQDPPTLIWAHARMGVLLTRMMRLPAPLAITLHGLPFGPGHRQPFAALAAMAERAFLHLGHPLQIVLLSASARQRYESRMGPRALRRHRLHVVENCSDLEPLPHGDTVPNRVRLLMTGRAGYQKNYAFAAQIMAHLPERFTLTICGTGTDSAAFRAPFLDAVGADSCARRLRCLGPLSDVRGEMAQSDLFLLTSRYEGMPIGALEAMQAGLPAALARIDGTQEILERHPFCTGFGLDDPAAAAARIEALADRVAAATDPGSTTRAVWLRWFSFDAWRGRVMRLLDEMLKTG